ncbi:MAG: hypothetical protein A2Y64_01455 [Candidatus Coatesbacteria bacterium RBG_13_66_14]|uniref:Phosphatase n=1 Tax=Candidatus Coatesbacteria bacterium RBG_13_66_14 TaxID=1817816 RepID=A0A1F5FHC6_9BACT|nr:MAG: hypothetical protein A2Y64_01455 [Candidatus Coatesbacteria bacterium RBG_13_66_14]
MAKIFPFRAYRYSAKAGDPKNLVTQPYDKISDELRTEYYARSEWNIARVIKSDEGPSDGTNTYAKAAELFRKMIAEGVLTRDDKPAVYAYDIEYEGPGGDTRVRSGFIATAQLEDFSKGHVKPHETTLAGPKADRLNLTRATGASFGLIFMLYPDWEMASDKLLDGAKRGRKPDLEVGDDFGALHRVWVITDEGVIAKLQAILEPVDLFIADGHHRYETVVNYMNEMTAKGKAGAGLGAVDKGMMAFVNMFSKGLTVFATHRLIHSLPEEKADPVRLIGELEKDFEIRVIPMTGGGEDEMLDVLAGEYAEHKTAFGLVIREIEEECYVLTLARPKAVDEFFGQKLSKAYKGLDVAVLHGLILEKILGIDAEALTKQTNVVYARDARNAIKRVHSGEMQMCFLMNPTRPEQVAEVAGADERMPQKSTDFYPKMITGLTINKFDV